MPRSDPRASEWPHRRCDTPLRFWLAAWRFSPADDEIANLPAAHQAQGPRGTVAARDRVETHADRAASKAES